MTQENDPAAEAAARDIEENLASPEQVAAIHGLTVSTARHQKAKGLFPTLFMFGPLQQRSRIDKKAEQIRQGKQLDDIDPALVARAIRQAAQAARRVGTGSGAKASAWHMTAGLRLANTARDWLVLKSTPHDALLVKLTLGGMDVMHWHDGLLVGRTALTKQQLAEMVLNLLLTVPLEGLRTDEPQ